MCESGKALENLLAIFGQKFRCSGNVAQIMEISQEIAWMKKKNGQNKHN